MVEEDNDCSTGAMQNPTPVGNNVCGTGPAVAASKNARLRSTANNFNNENDDDCIGKNNCDEGANHQNNSISSYLILSPSNPVRIFAISFLTHWIYSAVIVLTVCAFVISSVYCSVQSGKNINKKTGEPGEIATRKFCIVQVTRWLLFITLLLEILVKSIARGFFVGSKFAYLRILWDWLDITSLVFILLSIVIPWKTFEFIAAAVVLLKLIPIHPGSINASILLCSCAKKLIPVLLYGLIIVWMYGFIIFTLFVKYHPPPPHHEDRQQLFVHEHSLGVTKSNGSTVDTVDENGNNTESLHGSYLPPPSSSPTILEKSENFSRGLSMECLPTNFRSLSGSLIQAIEMLTLRYSQDNLSNSAHSSPPPSFSPPGTNTLSLDNETTGTATTEDGWSCQYETYTLAIIETLVIISGTLPMIIMSFAVLSHLFQKTLANDRSKKQSHQHHHHHHHHRYPDQEEDEKDDSFYPPCHQQNSYSASASSESHRLSCGQVIANSLCDCDYYFCCLANLQRKLSPCTSGLFSSKKFKVLVLLIVSTDFICMIKLLSLSNPKSTSADIDFPASWLIMYYCIQIFFILYTVEAVLRWFAESSDEYWTTIWPAFDLTMVIIYWAGFAVLHVRGSWPECYPALCGILMIRMLKIAPYWKTFENSLKLILFGVLRNKQNLLVILVCSCSVILLKYAAFMFESGWSSQLLIGDLIPSLPLDFYTFVESIFRLVFYFLCCIIVVAVHENVFNNMKTSTVAESRTPDTTRNPSISLLLSSPDNSCYDLGAMQHPTLSECRRSPINESPSPISIMSVPNGMITHPSSKYRLASSPCDSNNGLLLSNDTRSSILSPSSEVLSPLLSIPIPNGLNGYAHHTSGHLDDHEENGIGDGARNGGKRESFFYPRQSVSVEDVLNLTTAVVVILASANITLDSSRNGDKQMSWQSLYLGQSLCLEVFFIMTIALHIIYKTRLSRFSRDTFMQITSIADLIVILSASVQLFSSGMRWVPSGNGDDGNVHAFAECAKILSASRGLLLLSRISWLQCIGSGLCYLIWKVIKYVAAFGYLWVIFIISSTEAQKTIQGMLQGHSKTNATSALSESNNATDLEAKYAPTNKQAFEEDDLTLHPILLSVTMLLFLLSIAVFLGFLRHQIANLSQLMQKFMTKSQAERQQRSDTIRRLNFPDCPAMTSGQKISAQPTKGICVPILFFVTNHRTFDIILMAVIFLDALGITLEYFGTSERAFILRKHYPAYMLFLYSFEIGCKLYGNRLHFFKSYWNILDCTIITVSIIDYFANLISQSWITLLVQNVRFFRILRIFQFYPFIHRTQIIPKFFHAIPRVFYPLWNFLLFYFCLHIATLSFKIRGSHIVSESDSESQMTSHWPVVAGPFERISFPLLFDVFSSSALAAYSLPRTFYVFGQILFSLIKLSILFAVTFLLVIVLRQYLAEQDRLQAESTMAHSRSHSFHHHERARGGGEEGHYDFEEKTSHMIPCTSPDTADNGPPSRTGTSSAEPHNPANNNYSGASASCLDNVDLDSLDKPNNSLYRTTTITSSEEINGCKVFFVEAMITTV